MDVKPEELQKRMKLFKDGLKRAGVKLTHQRLEIFHEVAKSRNHPDAETIFKGIRKRLPTVSLDTIYRTLWLLLDLGLITTLGTPRDRVRFDANTSSHHHFFCTKCGMARDFSCGEFDQIKIPDAAKTFGRVEKTQVEVSGVCSICLKKINPEHSAKRGKEKH